eukprot:gene19252-biopygen22024
MNRPSSASTSHTCVHSASTSSTRCGLHRGERCGLHTTRARSASPTEPAGAAGPTALNTPTTTGVDTLRRSFAMCPEHPPPVPPSRVSSSGGRAALTCWEKPPCLRPVRVRSACVSLNSIVRPASGCVRCRFSLLADGGSRTARSGGGQWWWVPIPPPPLDNN